VKNAHIVAQPVFKSKLIHTYIPNFFVEKRSPLCGHTMYIFFLPNSRWQGKHESGSNAFSRIGQTQQRTQFNNPTYVCTCACKDWKENSCTYAMLPDGTFACLISEFCFLLKELYLENLFIFILRPFGIFCGHLV
jgi:hypothetical protein